MAWVCGIIGMRHSKLELHAPAQVAARDLRVTHLTPTRAKWWCSTDVRDFHDTRSTGSCTGSELVRACRGVPVHSKFAK